MRGFRDNSTKKLIQELTNTKQSGTGFNGEGSCTAGNYIFSHTAFFIPLTSVLASIKLSDIEYSNCTDLSIWRKDKFGFTTKVKALSDGEAYCFFRWKIIFKKTQKTTLTPFLKGK